jgi:hypothetical protein
MRISVFGLGYVGTVVAACLARQGHDILGVDPSATKVGLVNDGRSPIVEPGLDELIRSMVEAGRLGATADPEIAVRRSELAMVCVGTPSLVNGRTDLRQLERCCKSIGRHLRGMSDPPVVVVRSTVPPGTIRDHVTPWLERAARRRLAVVVRQGAQHRLEVRAVQRRERVAGARVQADALAPRTPVVDRLAHQGVRDAVALRAAGQRLDEIGAETSSRRRLRLSLRPAHRRRRPLQSSPRAATSSSRCSSRMRP